VTGAPVALLVRLAFLDAPYTVSDAVIQRVHDTVTTMYRSMSRDVFHFTWKVFPTVIQVPERVANYNITSPALRDLIRTKLAEAGYTQGTSGEKSYSYYVANFDMQGDPIGYSYGTANLVRGYYNAGYVAHELGHAIGLGHSHSYEGGAEVLKLPPNFLQHVEYGDVYDIMGWGWPLYAHFNTNFKRRLGWLDDNETAEVRIGAVYRLYAHDHVAHAGRLLSIRVPSGDAKYAYRFEYRSAYAGARTGAVVILEGFQPAFANSPSGVHLLDLTPQSRPDSVDFQDAVLVPGKEFKDVAGATFFRVLAVNAGTGNENGWVDVGVAYNGVVRIASLRNPRLLASAGLPVFSLTGRALKDLSQAPAWRNLRAGRATRIILPAH
jgi:hypothetical protein